ncbi:YciI family protein [Georgenia sp. TF02-10]|uniref:YciI family protein n=1 Tax=Georgenia sp. TF02-10 TaxID=2917725 RepID=UPI001FA6E410|nr:YciI family protein [Georgenia sp. TF02-10]UNX54732.1 YciI family protein [Georgenia sp. TF02-10]
MTQYLISVWGSEPDMYEDTDAAATQQVYDGVEKFNTRLQESGAWVFAGGLEAPSTATTVDGTGPDAVVTDGPFLETKEQLGGFWVVEAPDLDAALALARAASAACRDRVEVRPFQAE